MHTHTVRHKHIHTQSGRQAGAHTHTHPHTPGEVNPVSSVEVTHLSSHYRDLFMELPPVEAWVLLRECTHRHTHTLFLLL